MLQKGEKCLFFTTNLLFLAEKYFFLKNQSQPLFRIHRINRELIMLQDYIYYLHSASIEKFLYIVFTPV